MEEIETKIKIETDVAQLKREYKSLSVTVSTLKSEHDSLVSINKKKSIEQSQLNEDLKDTLNAIASAKLAWAQEKEQEEASISEKKKEIEDILNKKGELELQRQENTRILDENTKVLNQNRTILLEIQDKEVQMKAKENELTVISTQIETDRKLLADEVLEFKNKVNRVLKEVNK